jgi:hypothetical protein
MNEFDQFVKHTLKVKYYARYTDDFLILHNSRAYLEALLPSIEAWLSGQLHLILHPEKVSIQSVHRGVDFLGYVIFPFHRLLRTRTKRRMWQKLAKRLEEYEADVRSGKSFTQIVQSYLGVLSHANAHEISEEVKNQYGVMMDNQ